MKSGRMFSAVSSGSGESASLQAVPNVLVLTTEMKELLNDAVSGMLLGCCTQGCCDPDEMTKPEALQAIVDKGGEVSETAATSAIGERRPAVDEGYIYGKGIIMDKGRLTKRDVREFVREFPILRPFHGEEATQTADTTHVQAKKAKK